MRVRFTRDSAIYESDVPFLRGQEVDLPPSSVDRWLRRGAVVIVADVDAPGEDGVPGVDADVSRGRAKRKTR